MACTLKAAVPLEAVAASAPRGLLRAHDRRQAKLNIQRELVSELGAKLTNVIRRRPVSFEEYCLASKAWQSRGLTLASARALANAGVLTVEDLQSANSLELAMIPRIGAKSLALLYELKGEKVPDVELLCGKAKHLRSILGLRTGGKAATSDGVLQPVAPSSRAPDAQAR